MAIVLIILLVLKNALNIYITFDKHKPTTKIKIYESEPERDWKLYGSQGQPIREDGQIARSIEKERLRKLNQTQD